MKPALLLTLAVLAFAVVGAPVASAAPLEAPETAATPPPHCVGLDGPIPFYICGPICVFSTCIL